MENTILVMNNNVTYMPHCKTKDYLYQYQVRVKKTLQSVLHQVFADVSLKTEHVQKSGLTVYFHSQLLKTVVFETEPETNVKYMKY